MRRGGGLRRMTTLTESPVAARTPEEQLLPVARVALALLPSTPSDELRERRATAALRALQAAIDTWDAEHGRVAGPPRLPDRQPAPRALRLIPSAALGGAAIRLVRRAARRQCPGRESNPQCPKAHRF